jgi:hypothetical protein
MDGLDALPHGIMGLKQSIDAPFHFPWWLVLILVVIVSAAVFLWFKKVRKKQASVLEQLRGSLSTLPLDHKFTPIYSSLLRSGISEKYGIDIKCMLANDLSREVKAHSYAFSSGKLDMSELEGILRQLERELYLGLELSEQEKKLAVERALHWLGENHV